MEARGSRLRVKRWPGDKPIEAETVAREWAGEGFTCDLWIDPPGQEWIDFVHPVDEVVVVQEGALEFEVEGAKALLGPGDEVFIPAGALHSMRNVGGTVARWFYGYRLITGRRGYG